MYLKIAEKNVHVVSRLMAIVATALLLIYLAETISQEMYDATFLAMDPEVKGMVFGITSTILLGVAFVLELKEKSMITSTLLISGGAMMGTLAIARDALSDSGIADIATGFANAASVGYIIMGLGILHLVKLRENKD